MSGWMSLSAYASSWWLTCYPHIVHVGWLYSLSKERGFIYVINCSPNWLPFSDAKFDLGSLNRFLTTEPKIGLQLPIPVVSMRRLLKNFQSQA
jgi:hypothetical protein